MTLICLPEDCPQLQDLVDPALRESVAKAVNQAILGAEDLESEAKIRGLVRLRAWAGNEFKESNRKDSFPVLDLSFWGETEDEPMTT